MTERERLIGWIMDSVGGCASHWAEVIADGILERGGIAPRCKVGTEYFFPMVPDGVIYDVVKKIEYNGSTCAYIGEFAKFNENDIGRHVFFTYYEAEQMLRPIKNGGDS